MSAAEPPLPPADVAKRMPLLRTIKTGASLHRFHARRYAPIHFDRSSGGRFNAPDGAYGVLYVARERDGAFAETFLREPGRTLLDPVLLAGRAYVRLETTRPLVIVSFAGRGLARLGATAEVCHRGQPYSAPQAWSKALYDHPVAADGVAYTARHDDGSLCLAIFERAADALFEAEHRADLDGEDWLWQLADRYGIGIAP